MSVDTCGAQHPDDADVTCDRKLHGGIGFHRQLASGIVWPADAAPLVQGSGRAALADIASRAARHHRTGPASKAVDTWKEQSGS